MQGCKKGQKSGGAGSNAARRPAAPSDLPKSGGAAAPPAPPFGASLFIIKKTLKYLNIIILFLICLLFQRRHELTRKPGQTISRDQ